MGQRSAKDRAVRRYGWRRVGLVGAGLAALVGGGYWARTTLLPHATAQPAGVAQVPAAAPAGPAPAAAEGAPEGDYARRVVAYVHDSEPVTRQDLGEYLIARHGPEKLPTLVNVRIIEDVCRRQGIEVTAAEVESAVAEELQGVPDQANLLRQLLARYHVNFYEWKEEVVRPRLLLTRYCRQQVEVTPDEIQQAFQAAYGEKVECKVIFFPPGKDGEKAALAAYGEVRDSDDAFDRVARAQYLTNYAGTGGKVRPFGRFQMEDPAVDDAVFRLRTGEVSAVVKTRQGPAVFKCLRHLPAEPVALDSVRDKLAKDVLEKNLSAKMKEIMPQLRRQASMKVLLTRPKDRPGAAPVVEGESGPAGPGQVVARYNDGGVVTREELGEYLIACFGVEQLEMLVNRRIIDRECHRRGITVGDKEVDAGLAEDLKSLNVSEKVFTREFLGVYRKTLYEYREDAVRAKLLLGKLAEDRVKVTDADLKMAYEAYYGERLECRMILWPPDQTKFALAAYPKVRDSEAAFAEMAKQQPSPTLAARGGRLDPFGRHTLGDENLEREAFKLREGHVSTLVGTPQGNVILKCDHRIPANTSVTLEKVRPELEKDVRKRKLQMEMQVVFRELSEAACPKLLLRNPDKPNDLGAEVRKELGAVKEALKAVETAKQTPGP
jgi:parvulin-like peptidyl-prolyl isomerase